MKVLAYANYQTKCSMLPNEEPFHILALYRDDRLSHHSNSKFLKDKFQINLNYLLKISILKLEIYLNE